METYLVTGGAGFIGCNFVWHVLNTHRDARVINVDKLTYAGNLASLAGAERDGRYSFVRADICDREAMARLLAENEVAYVVNFAAESHVDRSIMDPGIFASTNVLGTSSLLEAARKAWEVGDGDYGDHRFLQVSTDEVYGSLGPEGFFTEATPLDPHSPYSASKASADLMAKAYRDTYGFPLNITRCSNNYGPYQFPEKLIPLMIHNALRHEKLPLYGDGLNIRDWLYVEDHCKAIDLVLRRAAPGEIYNVGGHNERTNDFIVRAIVKYLGENVDAAITEDLIVHVADRKGHDRRYGIDPSKIKADLGWHPETAFEEGIVRTIRWYLDNPAWVEGVITGEYRRYYELNYGSR